MLRLQGDGPALWVSVPLCDMLTVPTEASHGQRPGPLRPFPGVVGKGAGNKAGSMDAFRGPTPLPGIGPTR